MQKTTFSQQTKQLEDARERARLAKIFTRLALAGNALFVVIIFLATTGLCDFALLNPKSIKATTSNAQSTALAVSVETSCSLSAEVTSAHSATIANGSLQEDIGSTSIATACNNGGGWAVYAIGYGQDTLGNTDMYSPRDGSTIATGLATTGNTSAWAMKLAATTTGAPTIDYASAYAVIPSTLTKVAHSDTVSSRENPATFTTTYRTYVDPIQSPGTYTGKVKYVLVHPKTATPGGIESIGYMQEMNSTICELTNIGDTATLEDNRDHKLYTVAKYNDNKCWMASNLDLDLSTSTTLTPDDSNVSANWTPERSTIPQGQLSSSTWTNDNNHPYSYDSGNTSNGNYYNWSAAVASNDTNGTTSGNISGSICPRGWRLPDAGTANEFGNMLYAHNVITSPTASGSSAYASGGFNILTSAPLSFLRAGYVGGGSLYNAGSGSDYWSSTAYSSTNARNLDFHSSGIYPQSSDSRYYGFSVRCVAL